jgi:signal transduction histidine kinase
VTLGYRNGSIELEILDGGGAKAGGGAEGHGIVGMRERVALYGGEFAAGPRPEGGYRVWARLPAELARS